MSDFYQNPPVFSHPYNSDLFLKKFLEWKFYPNSEKKLENEYRDFSNRIVNDYLPLAKQAEKNPPQHIPFDPWGRRIDDLQVAPEWTKLEKVSAEEGLVAIGYERKHGAYSRMDQFIRLYLFHPASALFTCPLAMTDGAARALELYGGKEFKYAFDHLTSRDPEQFWTSGQWMTERTGGSDVSGTSTIAKRTSAGWELSGSKWFTSATTAQMAMALARIEGDEAGSKGLSLFFIPLRDVAGKLQNIQIHRLKDKLGTKALPTAELSLQGTPAKLVGEAGGGVKKISSLFNLTRIYNSICALSATRQAYTLALDYSHKREAFGKKIIDHPLQQLVLAEMAQTVQSGLLFTFALIELLGKEETNQASVEEKQLLRLLTPVLKLYTAKKCMQQTSEMIETFGGAGYIEDTGIPKWLRDAQVYSIWEGTTNVLSLDMLRALDKDSSMPIFAEYIQKELALIKNPQLKFSKEKILNALQMEMNWLAQNSDLLPQLARSLSFWLGDVFCAVRMLAFAEGSGWDGAKQAALYFCENRDFKLVRVNAKAANEVLL